jgi:hypothetical protein
MVLEFKGEVRATAYPIRCHESIMRQRKQWYYFYGLATHKEWEIYIIHKSEMKECKPFRIKEPFPYFTKSQNKQNESESESESRPVSLYCEPVDTSGGLVQTVGRRQSEVL